MTGRVTLVMHSHDACAGQHASSSKLPGLLQLWTRCNCRPAALRSCNPIHSCPYVYSPSILYTIGGRPATGTLCRGYSLRLCWLSLLDSLGARLHAIRLLARSLTRLSLHPVLTAAAATVGCPAARRCAPAAAPAPSSAAPFVPAQPLLEPLPAPASAWLQVGRRQDG